MGYGFCIPDNPCDEVTVQVGALPPAVQEKLKASDMQQFKSETWTPSQTVFHIRAPGHCCGEYPSPAACLRWIPPELFTLTLELILYNRGPQGIEHTDSSNPSGRMILTGIRQVVIPLRTKLRTIMDGAKDCPPEPRNEKQRYSQIYRDRQMDILSINVQNIEKVIQDLHDAGRTENALIPCIKSLAQIVAALKSILNSPSDPASEFCRDCFDGLMSVFGEDLEFTDSEDMAFIMLLYFFRASLEHPEYAAR
jgi:hypothetical protein